MSSSLVIPPYYDELVKAQEFLKQEIPAFPKLQCCRTARFLELQYGFEQQWGWYQHENGDHESHSWSIDAEGRYIDLTLQQFSFKRHPEEIVVMERLPEWINSDESLAAKERIWGDDGFIDPHPRALVEKYNAQRAR